MQLQYCISSDWCLYLTFIHSHFMSLLNVLCSYSISFNHCTLNLFIYIHFFQLLHVFFFIQFFLDPHPFLLYSFLCYLFPVFLTHPYPGAVIASIPTTLYLTHANTLITLMLLVACMIGVVYCITVFLISDYCLLMFIVTYFSRDK